MTLYELVYQTKLCGDIRVSKWENDEEQVIATWTGTEELFSGDIEDEWMDFEVDYIFASPDGFLHIEVKEDD